MPDTAFIMEPAREERSQLAVVLRRAGWEVEEFSKFEEMEFPLSVGPPSLLILSSEQGEPLVDGLRAKFQGRIVMFGWEPREPIAQRLYRGEVFDTLKKPIDLFDVRRVLERAPESDNG